MPTFEIIPLQEAMLQSSLTGKRGVITREYLTYIERLEPGKAGKLTIDEIGRQTAPKHLAMRASGVG